MDPTKMEKIDLRDGFIRIQLCPVCGSDGCTGSYFNKLHKVWTTEFHCDEDIAHHFLIIQLEPEEPIIVQIEL